MNRSEFLPWVLSMAVAASGCASAVGPASDDAAAARDGSAMGVVDATAPDAGPPPSDAGPPPPDAWGHPTPVRCVPVNPSELIAPRVLFPDQALGATATTRMSVTCGGTPQLDGTPPTLRMQVCGGCTQCDCIDLGYQASSEFSALPVGEYTLVAGPIQRPLSVVDPASCFDLSAAARDVTVEVIGPDSQLRLGGEMLWWAHVRGSESRCCSVPKLAARVMHTRPANSDLALSLFECEPDPCDCAGGPVPFEAWVNLGPLPRGHHVMLVGTTQVAFDVGG